MTEWTPGLMLAVGILAAVVLAAIWWYAIPQWREYWQARRRRDDRGDR
jgi:ABC-type protease/lipase transport system fused ATPase/permease subunit